MTSSTYMPRSHGLAYQLCEYFHRNADEELSLSDIELKYGAEKKSIPTQLREAVHNGLLVIKGALVFGGPNLAATWAGVAPPQLSDKPAATRKRRLPPLRLDQVKVQRDVPPPTNKLAKGRTLYDHLFDQLNEVGVSVQFPAEYHGAVSHASSVYAKRNAMKLSVRKVDENTSGVWRLK